METKTQNEHDFGFNNIPSYSKFSQRGAFTELNHKSTSNYSVFSTPRLFNKENSSFMMGSQTLLNFDAKEPIFKEATPSKSLESSENMMNSNLFSKTQMSRYKNNYVVSFNSNKKPPIDNRNKENKRIDPSELSDGKNISVKANGPLSNMSSNKKLDFSSFGTSQTKSTVNKTLSFNDCGSSSTYQEKNYLNEYRHSEPNSTDASPFSMKDLRRHESYDSRKLKKEAQISPRSKSYFDDIEKRRKDLNSKSSSQEILNFYMSCLNDVPSRYHWKLCLDVAEVFKKDCNYQYAKNFYKIAAYLQPYNADIWLEYAKMEEDYGNLIKVKDILKQGISFNGLNENLIIKFLRVEEKFGRIEESRKILSKLKNVSIDKSWKLYLEGAILEAKLGNPKSAQRIFKMLLKNLDMQGNIYLEYAKFEENMGNLLGALKISYEGLAKNIRFSNLWGYFMRICERIVEKIDYLPLNNYLNLANDCLPKDMLWKIYLEIAGVAERKEEYTKSKNFVTKAILSCPENVKWKCFVLGARMELKDQYPTKAKKIISKFIETASDKQRYHLLIEYSKICEFQGDLQASIQYFEETRDYMKTEWKVYLEFIHMLARNNKFGLAYQIAKESLYHHNLAGRLWASLIQIKNIISTESPGTDAYKLFLAAINEVPKSGEVWCEGARICLNPYSNRFDIEKARQFLNFAIYFTPQYGDSFVEAIRLCYISGDKKELANLKKKVINSQPNYGNVWQFLKKNAGESVHETWKNAKQQIKEDILNDAQLYKIRMNNLWESVSKEQNTKIQILTACNDYNLILQGKKQATQEERWKLIFHTDQSLL